MNRKMCVTATSLIALIAAIVGQADSQGRGAGRASGMCMRGGGMGYGAQAGWKQGGWWNRVTPKTPEQQAVVSRVTDLHNQIRSLNLELMRAQQTGESQDRVSSTQASITALRTELAKVSTENQSVLREMGLAPGAGICDGSGVAASGTPRWGRGNGMGRRGGMGPNCPLR